MKTLIFAALVAVLLAVGIYMEVSIWTECRETHSWLYCLRMVTR